MKVREVIVITSLIIFILSCKENPKEVILETQTVTYTNSKNSTKKIYESADATVKFKDAKVATIYAHYIALKTALVNTDAASATKVANSLLKEFRVVGSDDTVIKATQNIIDNNDIEVHRKSFVMITKAVEKILEGQIASGVIYKQYCPMAFDFEGGFWLSNSNQIYNPYFGDKMLRCGKVDTEIN